MDINVVKSAYLNYLIDELNEMREVLENTKKDIDDAPPRMETRYDSSKTELAWIANGQLLRVKQLEKAIDQLNSNNKVVTIGSFVKVNVLKSVASKLVFEKTLTYYIGHDEGNEGNEGLDNITEVKSNSEIANKLLGCKVDDVLEILISGIQNIMQIISIEVESELPVVDVNKLVCLKDLDFNEEEWYYITHLEGGGTLIVDGKEITVISKTSPLAKHIIGSRVKSEILFENDVFTRTLLVDSIH